MIIKFRNLNLRLICPEISVFHVHVNINECFMSSVSPVCEGTEAAIDKNKVVRKSHDPLSQVLLKQLRML